MIPPYQTQEVAEAVLVRAAEAEVRLRNLLVVADLRAHEWRVAATLAGDGRVALTLPFSTPRGIVLPADVASRFLAEAMSP